MNKKQFAQVYRDAAKRVEEYQESFSCCAVWTMLNGKEAGNKFEINSVRDYAEMFAPTIKSAQSIAWLNGYMCGDELRDWRILALCFAAAMIETGDLEVPIG